MKRRLGLLTSIVVLLVSCSVARAASGEWSVVSSPNPGSFLDDLSGVACISQTNCWAVGSTANLVEPPQTLIEHWDGSSWTVATTPFSYGELSAVSCLPVGTCYAVGQNQIGLGAPLIEEWNGTAWTILSNGTITGGGNSSFGGVSCPTATDCWVVGNITDSEGVGQPYGYELDNGEWQTFSGKRFATGQAVSCTSTSFCLADDLNGIEHWNGATWSVPNNPLTSGALVLLGVDCFSASSCWVTGRYPEIGNKKNHTLVEEWNGSAVKIVRSASVPATISQLDAVACETATKCWAVGDAYNQTTETVSPLNEDLTTTGWTLDSTAPNPTQGALDGATCSGNECWAVGYIQEGTTAVARTTLIEQRTN